MMKLKFQIKYFLCGLLVKLDYIRQAMRQINDIHIGSKVYYNGEICVVTQGVKMPKWNLTGKDSHSHYVDIHQDKFIYANNLKDKIHAFKTTYRFKMDYWFRIEVGRMMRGEPKLV